MKRRWLFLNKEGAMRRFVVITVALCAVAAGCGNVSAEPSILLDGGWREHIEGADPGVEWYIAGYRNIWAHLTVSDAITRPFTAYAFIARSTTDKLYDAAHGFSRDLKPVAEKVPGVPAGFRRTLRTDDIPSDFGPGSWNFYIAFFDPDKPMTKPEDAFLLVSTPFNLFSCANPGL
jgi:hypothetical protein